LYRYAEVDEFCYITDNTYAREDVLAMVGAVYKLNPADP
jgi:hypothetical protein